MKKFPPVYMASTPICDSWEKDPNLLIFGGPCRGRTYGPLIKSVNRPIFQSARCCEGFPIYL
jgi:hypothetical protein